VKEESTKASTLLTVLLKKFYTALKREGGEKKGRSIMVFPGGHGFFFAEPSTKEKQPYQKCGQKERLREDKHLNSAQSRGAVP